MDVVWKDSLANPTKYLTKLSQFFGAYATATIDKAEEVKLLLKQKEDKFQELEKLLEQENFNSIKQIEMKMSQFQKDFYRLKLQHQVQISEKETQIEVAMDKLKIQPQTEKFIKEALEWNT